MTEITVSHNGDIETKDWTGSDVFYNGQHYRYDGGLSGGRLYNLSNNTDLVKIFNHGNHFLTWLESLV